jgi:RNA polymerase sigma factor (sigma-70 family)
MSPACLPSQDHFPAEDEAIRFIAHPSFQEPDAARLYDWDAADEAKTEATHLHDDATRDLARRMHYAAYRLRHARTAAEVRHWRQRYYTLRNRIVLGNRKLVYRMVGRWSSLARYADDLIGEGYLVLIRAVTVYNPWLGVRFSTYACTCLMRALARLAQHRTGDRLRRAWPLEAAQVDHYVAARSDPQPPAALDQLGELLDDGHPLLSPREKMVLRQRYGTANAPRLATLAAVGCKLGISKERVRQVEKVALTKLRAIMSNE